MAAKETFDKFNASLSRKESESIGELISRKRAELFAARSEDARVRLIQEYIEEVRRIFGRKRGR